MTINYFSKLVSISNLQGIKEVVEVVESKIDLEMSAFLDPPFTPMEIREALFQIRPTTSPGLDGMTLIFIKSTSTW